MLLMIHPRGVGLGVLLLLLAGRLGIVRPDRHPLAIGRRRVAADLNCDRLVLFLVLLRILAVGLIVFLLRVLVRVRRRNRIFLLRFIHRRHYLQIIWRSFAAAQVEPKELAVLAALGHEINRGSIWSPLRARFPALVR